MKRCLMEVFNINQTSFFRDISEAGTKRCSVNVNMAKKYNVFVRMIGWFRKKKLITRFFIDTLF